MPKGMKPEVRALIVSKINELLERPGMSQQHVAAHCRVDQGTVSKWASGVRPIGPGSLISLAHLAPEEEKEWWYSQAGVAVPVKNYIPAKNVPLFKGKIAAGHGREIEGEIEQELPLPPQWFAPGSNIVALKVDGDSMAPLVNSGYYVLIDTSEREPKRLAGHMVAARSPHGCTVKWLRKSTDTGYYQLIPQHVSEEYPIRTITPQNVHEFGLIGRVVKWIGEPKPPRRVKR
jgi:SOS-response transcriptional repressor LexA